MAEGFVFLGVDAFKKALDERVAKADVGARQAATAGAHLIEARTKKLLGQTSHKKGTPTPSAAGQPPSLVSGTLRRSVKTTTAKKSGPGTWQASCGPTTVYSRIQELGGEAGRRSRRVRLPPRPYLGPAFKELVATGELWAAMKAAWAKAK